MSGENFQMYAVDDHIAEIYDQSENYKDDVELLRNLIGDRQNLNILEPFCGTGRILIPLAEDGHSITGLDAARGMLRRAEKKAAQLTDEVKKRISLMESNVITEEWPNGYDLVLLGGNCFYELASAEEQESCIRKAYASLKSGGTLFVDNNHMEGDLAESWQQKGVFKGFPSGTCQDGGIVESTTEVIWFDVKERLIKFRRTTRVTLPDQSEVFQEYVQQKHPVSTEEVRGWLEQHDFDILQHFGARDGSPYSDDANRSIFWARKR